MDPKIRNHIEEATLLLKTQGLNNTSQEINSDPIIVKSTNSQLQDKIINRKTKPLLLNNKITICPLDQSPSTHPILQPNNLENRILSLRQRKLKNHKSKFYYNNLTYYTIK
jgi:hypothetical protein